MLQKKKLMLYTNYYYPEVASLAQLCTDLCEGLADEFDVTVVCSVPCYTGVVDEQYRQKKVYFEEHNGVKIVRVRVPSYDKQSKGSRVKNILTYFFRAIWVSFRVDKVDYIITESQPPVLGGLLGVAGKWIQRLRGRKAKMLYVIQDYNPEQTMVVGFSRSKLILRAMMCLDKLSCRIADKVIVVGSDMVETMKKRFTKRNGEVSRSMPKTVFINNWMDERVVYPLDPDHSDVRAFKEKYGLTDKFVVMYSGNIGLFYDLENLLKVIERFADDENVVFPFVGEGTLRGRLMEYAAEHNLKNVVFIPYQPKETLVYSLNAADVHWVVNAEGVKGVSCPSKLYGVLATAKPVLAVLEEGTEARNIVESTHCGYTVSPKDYDGIAQLIERFAGHNREELQTMGERGRAYMLKHLTRDISIEKYRWEIKNC